MRFSKYNIYTEVDKGLVIYNIKKAKYVNIFNEPDLSYVRKLISLKELPEDDNIVKALYSNGFVVSENDSEYESAKNEILDLLEENKKSVCITLYVTDNCNFRCVYCPQEHKPTSFSDSSWEGLYKYLEKNIVSQKLNAVVVSFFGGEPLLKSTQIVSFLTKMKKLSNKYPDLKTRYSITTNGFLLTPDLYDKLAELGVKDIQVTLDGFAETHNKTRPLANGTPTWDVIVKNFDYINTKNDDVTILLRSNINSINSDSVYDFIKWIDKKYNKEKFLINFQPVSKINSNVDDKYVQEDETFKKLLSLQVESGRSANNNVNFLDKLGLACRYAANYLTITTDANVYKCEYAYFPEVEPVGYLDDDGEFVLNEKYPVWTEDFEHDCCKDCIIYPLCAARTCIKDSANGLFNEQDCKTRVDDIIKYINKSIKDGSLQKRS